MDIIDIMNMVKVKGYVYGIIIIICLTGIMVFVYNTVITTIMGIIKGEDYIYYDPKQIPLFLYFLQWLLQIYPLFNFIAVQKKTDVIMQRFMIPTMVYTIAAFVIGISVNVDFFYPLSTDYYQCKSTSIVSSGSYYARTKEMCKQRAYISTNEEERSPGKPGKDRLESPVQ
jgi:hypothetical protein